MPKKLKGPNGLWCALDVVEGKRADQNDLLDVEPGTDDLCERLRGWDTKIYAGSQISRWENEADRSYAMGTLSAFARMRSDGTMGFLANQHIGISEGKKLYHPIPWGIHLGTTTRTIDWLRDEEYYGKCIDEPNAYVRLDCAFAELSSEEDPSDLKPQMMGVASSVLQWGYPLIKCL